MLAARRDSLLDQEADDVPSSPRPGADPHRTAAAPAFTRFIAGVQILGTVLAIPVGLASGYSIYRSNFSPEAKCGTLRANIISMLDKQADAATLRLLVRRDVTTFERSCGAVDPDAVAAFKTLLAKPRTVAVAKETKPAEPEKQVAHAAVSRREPARRVAAKTALAHHNPDADWLAAVRRALVDHAPVARAQAADAPMSLTPPPAVRPMGAPLPAQPQAAPALPSATSVADAPAPQSDESHPVPPAPIPNVGLSPAH